MIVTGMVSLILYFVLFSFSMEDVKEVEDSPSIIGNSWPKIYSFDIKTPSVNLTIFNCTGMPGTGGYNWCVNNSYFQLGFKNNLTDSNSIVFSRGQNQEYFIRYEPYALYFENESRRQLISYAKPVSPTIEDDTIIYYDAFGTNIDLMYRVNLEGLKEQIVFVTNESIPELTLTGNVTIDVAFKFSFSEKLKTWLKDHEWDELTLKEIKDKIEFKDLGNLIFWVNKPFARDASARQVDSTYRLYKNDTDLFIVIKTPVSKTSRPAYPFYIDPSTTYNFTQYVTMGHKAYEKGNATPSNPWEYDSEATIAQYQAINNSDDSWWQTSLADMDGEYNSQIYHFNISEDLNNIGKINVKWEGHSDNNVIDYDLSAFVWNNTNSSWIQINTISTGPSSDVTWTKEIADVSNFVNVSGNDKWVYVYVRHKHYFSASCPFIYSWDGEKWSFEKSIFPGFYSEKAEKEQSYILNKLESTDGFYKLKLAERRPETSYIDSLRFDIVDHPAGTKVLSDSDGNLHTLKNLIKPISCKDSMREDCLDLIENGYWKSDLGNWERIHEYIELEFPKENAEEAKFVLKYRSTSTKTERVNLLPEHFGQYFSPFMWLHDNLNLDWQEGMKIKAFVWNGREWIEQGSFATSDIAYSNNPEEINPYEFIMKLNLSGIETDKLKVRLEWAGVDNHEIYSVGIDYSKDEEMIVHSYYPEEFKSRVVMDQGDEIEFKLPELPERENYERTYVLATKGYYKIYLYPDVSLKDFSFDMLKILYYVLVEHLHLGGGEVSAKWVPPVQESVHNTLYTDYVDVVVTLATTQCQELDTPNEYYILAADIDDTTTGSDQACMNITAQNVTLDCQGFRINGTYASGNRGVYSNQFNSTVKNCVVGNWTWGIYYYHNSNNGTIQNVTVRNNTEGIMLNGADNNILTDITVNNNSDCGLYFVSADNNWLTDINANYNGVTTAAGVRTGIYFSTLGARPENNTIINSTVNNNYRAISIVGANNFINITAKNNIIYGISLLDTTSNNNVINSSIYNNIIDYYLYDAGSTNYFRNTNFTGNRKIWFWDSTNWFNYANDTSDLWLMSNASAAANITRKLVNWNNTLMIWNDTNNTAGITMRYNITGLNPNKVYQVFNNSVSTYNLTTDPSGKLPSFTIYLGSVHEIKVQQDEQPPKYWDNSTNNTMAGEPTLFSLRWTDNFDLSGYLGLSGYIFSISNGTGVNWVNYTWSPFFYRPSDYAYSGEVDVENPEYAYDKGVNDTSTWANINSTSGVLVGQVNYTFNVGNISGSTVFYTWFNQSDTSSTTYPQIRAFNYTSGSWYIIDNTVGDWSGNPVTENWTVTSEFLSNEELKIQFRVGYLFNISVTDIYIETNGCWSNVTKIINSTQFTTIKWCVYANDSSDNWNGTSCEAGNEFTLTTEKIWLEVNLTKPNSTYQDPANPLEVNQNTIFNVSSKNTCKTGDCGTVYGTVRYNKSSANPDAAMNTTEGAKPFYITKALVRPIEYSLDPWDTYCMFDMGKDQEEYGYDKDFNDTQESVRPYTMYTSTTCGLNYNYSLSADEARLFVTVEEGPTANVKLRK